MKIYSYVSDMLAANTCRLLTRPIRTWIINGIEKRTKSTAKLTSSYFHHVPSSPLVYRTISQNFDVIAEQNSDHECFVFKSKTIILHLCNT